MKFENKNLLRILISEYRKLTKDQISSDDKILKRLQFLEAFCRNVTKLELKNYLDKYERKKRQQ